MTTSKKTTVEKVKWTTDQEIELIDFYHDHEFLWDPKHVNYHKKKVKSNALEELAFRLGEGFNGMIKLFRA